MITAMKAASVPLNDAQKVAVLGVLEDKQAAMESLRSQTDRAAAMQQRQALEQAARNAILSNLSDAQKKVYLSLRQGRPAAPPQNGSGAVSPPSDDSNIDANTGGGISQGGPPAPPTQ